METTSQEEYAREVSKRYVGESGFMLFGEKFLVARVIQSERGAAN